MSERKGITFKGETFLVPETHDMVKTLFDPTVRKSMFEIVIVTLLIANSLVFWAAESKTRIQVFTGLYVFWRLSYNFGIGYLLNQQSNKFRLVQWAENLKVFQENNTSLVSRIVKTEVQTQMGKKYRIQKYPVDFNTWLIFRKVVDLILMQDFTAFVCLVVAICIDDDYQFMRGDSTLAWTRVGLGVSLILFNLWVKVNAHNTIKDYAWYWGDFFFRQINNEDLIFDGVFEMFPHPMYSIGYIGYYGFALIAKSYLVLTVAIFGHFLQMVFLHYIENPHIDKIYGPSPSETGLLKLIKIKDLTHFQNMKPLVGLANFNLLRASDFINLINVLTYSVLIPILASISSSNIKFVTRLLFYLAILIKALECVSINTVLFLQSKFKVFSKFYLANSIPVENSLNNFAILYNSLINLTYSSFFGLNLYKLLNKAQFSGDLLAVNNFYLRVFFGVILVVTQIWINFNIIDSIGYFGWFYGDFFIPKSSLMPQRSQLTKAGIYRYLNNPEQVFGMCGVMGITLIIPTLDNVLLCLLWTVNNFFRINFIEKLHMINVYGETEVLKDSGVTKTLKKHFIPESLSKKTPEFEKTKKKRSSSFFLESFDKFLNDGGKDDQKQSISELSQSRYFSNSDYILEVEPSKESNQDIEQKTESNNTDFPSFYVGEAISVKFKAPKSHSKYDWVGLYRITQSSYSRYKTLISSQNRWTYTGEEASGSLLFSGEKLFWDSGFYEFRYHIDGKHDVAYVSKPIEIKHHHIEIPTQADEASVSALAEDLRRSIFNQFGCILSDESTPIFSLVSQSPNVLDTYVRLSEMISKSTGIAITKRFLIYNDNESKNTFTVAALARKLIHIKSALRELSPGDDLVMEKKEQ